jgi:hypothetical protein
MSFFCSTNPAIIIKSYPEIITLDLDLFESIMDGQMVEVTTPFVTKCIIYKMNHNFFTSDINIKDITILNYENINLSFLLESGEIIISSVSLPSSNKSLSCFMGFDIQTFAVPSAISLYMDLNMD